MDSSLITSRFKPTNIKIFMHSFLSLTFSNKDGLKPPPCVINKWSGAFSTRRLKDPLAVPPPMQFCGQNAITRTITVSLIAYITGTRLMLVLAFRSKLSQNRKISYSGVLLGNLVFSWCYWRLWARVLMFNHLCAFWPEDCQCGSVGKSNLQSLKEKLRWLFPRISRW